MKAFQIIFIFSFVISNHFSFAQGAMVNMFDHYGHYIYDIQSNDQDEVWTAGDNQIMYSEDSGDHWININFPFPDARLLHISALSKDNIIAIGKEFHLTLDGGATWEVQSELTQIEDVFQFDQTVFISRNIDQESVMRSDDGGKNWNVIQPMDIVRAKTISFLSANLGHCSDDIGNIYKTTDAGETWTIINNTDFTAEIKLMAFRSEEEAYLIQEKNFYQTTDGGISWTLLHDDVSTQVKALFATPTDIITLDSRYKAYDVINNRFNTIIDKEDYNLIWSNGFDQTSNFQFVSGNGIVMRKPINNVWDDWVDLTPGPNIGFDQIAFSGNKILLGGPHRIQYSEDNGLSFTEHNSPGFTYLEDIAIFPNGHFYVATNGLQKSEDNGATWEFTIIGNRFQAFDNDNIIRHHAGSIYRTNDAGITWDSLHRATETNVQTIYFYDENFGWLFGGGPKANRTLDGGITWEVIEIGISSPTQAQFVNHQVGFGFFKYRSSFFKTIDGGDTWTISSVDHFADDIIDIHFDDELHGWVAGQSGEHGIILETFDGGDTWNVFQKGIDEFMRISRNEATNEVWAIGRSAQLFKFAICDNLSPTLIQADDRITCSESGSSYKWYFENEFLVETTENFLDLVALGEYAVRVVGDEKCVSELSPSLDVISNIEELPFESFAKVYPNPNNGSFNVSIPQEIDINEITLYNSTGQAVDTNYEFTANGFQVRTSELTKGMYFIKVKSLEYFDIVPVVIQ